jgi:anti-sigma B factor antagonist
VRVWRDRNASEIHVEGRIGVDTVGALRATLYDAVDRAQGDVVLVLRDADIADATGLGLLVGVHRRAAGSGKRLRLRDVSPRIAAALRTTGLRQVLTVERRPVPVG